MQLVSADDVAATVAELAVGAPQNGRVELGGPRRWRSTPGRAACSPRPATRREVVGDTHARYFGTELHGGELTPGDGARIGAIDFETWFAAQSRAAS